MKIRAQDALSVTDHIQAVEDLDTVLELSVDDALALALSKTDDKELGPEWYEAILAKLGETEQDAYTMGLASAGVKVRAAYADGNTDYKKQVGTIISNLKSLVSRQGVLYEEDYHEALYGQDTRIVAEVNAWIMEAMIPLKKNIPKGDVSEQYKKKIKKQVTHPNVREMAQTPSIYTASKKRADRYPEDYDIGIPEYAGDSYRGELVVAVSKFHQGQTDPIYTFVSRNDYMVSPVELAAIESVLEEIISAGFIGNIDADDEEELDTAYKDIETAEAWLPVIKKLVEAVPDEQWELDSSCDEPGRKERSKGKGRGLGLGKGKGPRGIPIGEKESVLRTCAAELEEDVDEYKGISGEEIIKALRKIVDEQQYAKINGQIVDLFSASTVVQVVDALNEVNRAKFLTLPLEKMVNLAFGVIAKKARKKSKKLAQAVDFIHEQSELERAVLAWEPKLPNIQEWLNKVRQSKTYADVKNVWDQLWRTKEEVSLEYQKTEPYRETIEFGDEDDEPLELASSVEREFIGERGSLFEAQMLAADKSKKADVRKFMRNYLMSLSDNELMDQNATALAETAADEFDHDEWLDDKTHWIWDLATETLYEAIKAFAYYPIRSKKAQEAQLVDKAADMSTDYYALKYMRELLRKDSTFTVAELVEAAADQYNEPEWKDDLNSWIWGAAERLIQEAANKQSSLRSIADELDWNEGIKYDDDGNVLVKDDKDDKAAKPVEQKEIDDMDDAMEKEASIVDDYLIDYVKRGFNSVDLNTIVEDTGMSLDAIVDALAEHEQGIQYDPDGDPDGYIHLSKSADGTLRGTERMASADDFEEDVDLLAYWLKEYRKVGISTVALARIMIDLGWNLSQTTASVEHLGYEILKDPDGDPRGYIEMAHGKGDIGESGRHLASAASDDFEKTLNGVAVLTPFVPEED